MATVQTMPASAGAPHPAGIPHPGAATTERAVAGEAVRALVPVPPQGQEEASFKAPIPQLPVELDVIIPVREFRVRELLALAPGQVIETQWSHGDDLPLAAGEVQLAWSEFEVIETRLAVRVTRLA